MLKQNQNELAPVAEESGCKFRQSLIQGLTLVVVVPALHFSALILYVLGLRSGRFSLNDPKHNLRCPEAISLQPVIRDNESLLTPASLSKSLKSLIGFLGSCVLVSANQRAGGGTMLDSGHRS